LLKMLIILTIDSDISESEKVLKIPLSLDNPYVRVNSRFSTFENSSYKRRQHEKKSATSKLWNNENRCKEMDIQVEYNS
ncbi:12305_t:CDS:2, partial [Dentiscutata heterogama]